jgi:putative oxidoreductase
VLELVGAVAISIGYRTRVFAFVLAAYVVLAALLFHADFNDPVQQSLFMRDLAMAGGFLVILARGPGDWSLDARTDRQLGEPAVIPR